METEFVNTKGTYPTSYLIGYFTTWVLVFFGTLSYGMYLGRGTEYSIEIGALIGTFVFAWMAIMGTLLMKGVTPATITITDTSVIGAYPSKASQGLSDRKWEMPFERIYKVNTSTFGCYVSAYRGAEFDMKKPFPQPGAGGYMPLNLENARHVKKAWEDWTRTNVVSVGEDHGRRTVVFRRESPEHVKKVPPPFLRR
jgi:hypothetical protein